MSDQIVDKSNDPRTIAAAYTSALEYISFFDGSADGEAIDVLIDNLRDIWHIGKPVERVKIVQQALIQLGYTL